MILPPLREGTITLATYAALFAGTLVSSISSSRTSSLATAYTKPDTLLDILFTVPYKPVRKLGEFTKVADKTMPRSPLVFAEISSKTLTIRKILRIIPPKIVLIVILIVSGSSAIYILALRVSFKIYFLNNTLYIKYSVRYS